MPQELQLKRESSQVVVQHTSTLQRRLQKLVKDLEGDEKTGAKVVLKAMEAPLFHIAANAGLEGSVIINKIKESEVGVGFDAYNETYVNMIRGRNH